MSGESTPILSGVIPAFETFMTRWETLSNNTANPQLKELIKPGLDYANKYYARMDLTKAYIIAMGKRFILISDSRQY